MKKNFSLLFMSFLFLLFFSCSDFNISENAFIKISIPEVNSRSVSSNQSMKFLLTVTQKNSNEKITAEGKSGETILVELESGIYALNLKAYAKNDTEFKTVLYEGSKADVQVEANKTTDVSIKLHRQLFTITFKDGEKVISVVDVNRNSKVTQLETPVREGYTFDGWYNGETLYDFESPVKSDLTLTAKWNEIKKDTDEIDEKTDEPEKEPEEKTDDLEEPEKSENKENTEESKEQTPKEIIDGVKITVVCEDDPFSTEEDEVEITWMWETLEGEDTHIVLMAPEGYSRYHWTFMGEDNGNYSSNRIKLYLNNYPDGIYAVSLKIDDGSVTGKSVTIYFELNRNQEGN